MNNTPPNTVLPASSSSETTVLLVDDDHSLLRLHQIMLERFFTPARVTAVDNALEAMLHLEREVPDLVVVDLNMPGIDGVSLLNLLASEERYAAVARVILSGMTAKEISQRSNLPSNVVVMQKPLNDQKMQRIQTHRVALKEAQELVPLQSNPVAEATPLMNKKILIVDDNSDIRRLLTITLNPHYDVLEAVDGESGLFAMYRHRPDLILLDIMLSGELNGLQVLEMIRSDPAYRDTLVAMITARGQKTDYLAGQAYGADAYFVKPLSPRQVLDWCASKFA